MSYQRQPYTKCVLLLQHTLNNDIHGIVYTRDMHVPVYTNRDEYGHWYEKWNRY